jgi:hypothetical protein
MVDTIRTVVGDEFPIITVTLTDEFTGNAIDLSNSGTVVTVLFHLAGTVAILSTIPCTKVGDGSGGQVTFNFTAGELTSVDPGAYEGDIKINVSGNVQTVFDKLRFRVRAAVV